MAKSQRPRLRDLRAIYLLIGECRELGADPVAWQLHLLAGLTRTLDVAVGLSFDIERLADPGQRADWVRPAFTVSYGFPGLSEQQVFRRHFREGTPDRNPVLPMVANTVRPLFTFTRRQVVEDRRWYGDDFIREYIRQTHLDDFLGSISFTSPASAHAIGLSRPRGTRPFERREHRLFHLCNLELVRLRGTRLATNNAPSVTTLAPRLRQVLLCLFDGGSEKQAAARLGISGDTVHEYLRRLHRLFGVSSRGELLARCVPSLRGQPEPCGAGVGPDG